MTQILKPRKVFLDDECFFKLKELARNSGLEERGFLGHLLKLISQHSLIIATPELLKKIMRDEP